MGFLQNLLKVGGQTAGVAGAGLEGFATDQNTRAARVLSQAKLEQDAQRNAVLNRIGLAGIDPSIQRQLSGAKSAGEVEGATPGLAARSKLLAPLEAQAAALKAHALIAPKVEEITATSGPEAQAAGAKAKAVGENTPETKSPVTTTTVTPAGSTQTIGAFGNKSGTVTPTGALAKGPVGGTGALAARIAAKVGQFGEMLKKAHDLTSMTDNLDVTVGQSATRDLAEHGLHVPLFGTVPGSKGVGSVLMGQSPQYAQYQAALSPFILAAAHALSGALINQDQVEQIRKSIELAPSDFTNKEVRAQKEKNMIDLINSIGGSLPKDAIDAQESQMDEPSITGLVGRGYRRVGGPAKDAPTTGTGKTVVINGKTFTLPP